MTEFEQLRQTEASPNNSTAPTDLSAQMWQAIQIKQSFDSAVARQPSGQQYEKIGTIGSQDPKSAKSLELTDPFGDKTIFQQDGTGKTVLNGGSQKSFQWKELDPSTVSLEFSNKDKEVLHANGNSEYTRADGVSWYTTPETPRPTPAEGHDSGLDKQQFAPTTTAKQDATAKGTSHPSAPLGGPESVMGATNYYSPKHNDFKTLYQSVIEHLEQKRPDLIL